MANQEHNMEDIFREALSSHEMDVSPKVWAGVSSSLGQAAATSAGASAGSAFLAKAAAVIGVAGLVTAATIAEVNYHQALSDAEVIPTEQVTVEAMEPSTNTISAPLDPVQTERPAIADENATSTEKSTPEVTQDNLDASSEEHDVAMTDMALEAEQAMESQTEGAQEEATPEKETVDATEQASSPNTPKMDREQREEPAPTVVQNTVKEEKEQKISTTAYFTHDAKQFITPNGDGFNEHLIIEGYGFDQFTLQVMTQGGQLVFESNDINVRWTGVDRFGNALPNGVYFYEIRAVGTDGLPYVDKNARGSVTIKR